MSEKIFIGVSWPYANGPLHLGHLAGQHIVVDVFSRYHRLAGNQVLMVSGSDMHGTPITVKAEKEGVSPYDFAMRNHKEFLKVFKQLDLYYDLYTHTHTKNHFKVVQTLTKVLYKLGFLIKKKTKQFYDPYRKQFLLDRYVEGTCPYCGYNAARGDQCDKCGSVLTPTELINPISKLSDKKPVLKETTDLYFDLPRFERYIKFFLKDKNFWRTHTLALTKAWLRQGLKPRPITRDLEWGIPVPIKGFENKVIYVWFEAVIGYLSASILWAKKKGDPSAWEQFWKDPAAKHYYFIAKDNIPFHTIFWPAQIIGFNFKYKNKLCDPGFTLDGETSCEPLNLPYNVVANNYLNIKGEKMSKSRGTFITAKELLDQYSPELVRFFFVRYAPENHDLDFDIQMLKSVNNNELVATIGNLIYRVLAFAYKNYGQVPHASIPEQKLNAIRKAVVDIGQDIKDTKFASAALRVIKLAQKGNQWFNAAAPWKAPKSAKAKAGVRTAIEVIEGLRVVFQAMIPSLSVKTERSFAYKFDKMWTFKPIPAGVKLTKPQHMVDKV